MALAASVCTGADYCFFPEMPPQKDGWESAMIKSINKGRMDGKRCTIVIVAEGATDRNGRRITSEYIKNILEYGLNLDTRVTVLGHVQRGGTPSPFDRYLVKYCIFNST